jgi:hypothetical protein
MPAAQDPKSERTFTAAPTGWKYDAQNNRLWLKLTEGTNTVWFPIQLTEFPRSVDHTGAA